MLLPSLSLLLKLDERRRSKTRSMKARVFFESRPGVNREEQGARADGQAVRDSRSREAHDASRRWEKEEGKVDCRVTRSSEVSSEYRGQQRSGQHVETDKTWLTRETMLTRKWTGERKGDEGQREGSFRLRASWNFRRKAARALVRLCRRRLSHLDVSDSTDLALATG